MRKNWFSNRVVDEWNRLNNDFVSAQTLASFKRKSDKVTDEDDRGK